jgi:hypothetical protein
MAQRFAVYCLCATSLNLQVVGYRSFLGAW